MKNKIDVLRLLSIGGLAFGAIATMISDYVSKKETERYIDEKFDALADSNNEEEEESE